MEETQARRMSQNYKELPRAFGQLIRQVLKACFKKSLMKKLQKMIPGFQQLLLEPKKGR
jgi:hypothetical protein